MVDLPTRLRRYVNVRTRLFNSNLHLLISNTLSIGTTLPNGHHSHLPSNDSTLQYTTVPTDPDRNSHLSNRRRTTSSRRHPRETTMSNSFSSSSTRALPRRTHQHLINRTTTGQHFTLNLIIIARQVNGQRQELARRNLQVKQDRVLILIKGLHFLQYQMRHRPSMAIRLSLRPDNRVITNRFHNNNFTVLLNTTIASLTLIILQRRTRRRTTQRTRATNRGHRHKDMLLTISGRHATNRRLISAVITIANSK